MGSDRRGKTEERINAKKVEMGTHKLPTPNKTRE
ncbi:uncharacterized protein G2W53_020340 [Senna tora]|uniref:Uncharacterized protein n=1 Tax=Senna tora TaxID=362788 RepID=A0A834WRD8_9FABA|nr:uncharacterized protein G2W53_020340 [Senna tora]